MPRLITQDFICETRESNSRYVEIDIHFVANFQWYGIGIDDVKQGRIRRAIEQAVAEAISIGAK